MNENVTNKITKGKRWLSRLLVSALCVLLASSLLFVTVVAENVNSFTLEQWAINTIGGYPRYTIGYWIDSSDSDMGYVRVGVLPDRSTLLVEAFSSYDTLIKSFTYVTSYFNLYDVSGCSSYGDYIAICVTVGDGSSSSLSYILGFNWNAVLLETYAFGGRASSTYVFFNGEEFGFVGSVTPSGESSSSSRYFLGDIDLGGSGNSALLYDTTFHSWFFVTNSYYFNVFTHAISYQSQTSLNSYVVRMAYSGKSVYHSAASSLLGSRISSFLSFDDGVRSSVSSSGVSFSFPSATSSYVLILSAGAFVSSSYSSSVVGVSITRHSGTSGSNPFLVYATSSEYVPPESSDETTESPPPESSDESSEESSEDTLKIWKTEFERDGSFASVALTTIDSSNVETIRAFLGGVAASDSDVSYDGSSVLSVELIDSGGSTIDILTFGFSAWGFALADGYTENFTFPDYVGYWFTLPYSGQQDLYFADVSPFGSVLINSYDSVDGTSARVGINLTSVDSYCKFDFGGEDVFGIRVFNANPDGNFKQFDFGVTAYKEYYYSSSGSSLQSDWIPVADSSDEGYSLTFTSSDIVDNGLYGFFLKASKSVYPSINSERLDEISLDYEFLESKANELYGQFTFDPLFGDNFGGAVDEFDDIKDSSGGSYVLNYLLGMWSIHPFASSMIAIVGTLAIVGFIIRKM